jgi:hypothetical protein
MKFKIYPKEDYIYELTELSFKIKRKTDKGELQLTIPKIDKSQKNLCMIPLLEYQTDICKESYNFSDKFSEILLKKTKSIVIVSNNRLCSIAKSLNIGFINSNYLYMYTIIDCYITDINDLLNNNVIDSLYEAIDYFYNLVHNPKHHQKFNLDFNHELFGLQLNRNSNKIIYERELIAGTVKIEIPYMNKWDKKIWDLREYSDKLIRLSYINNLSSETKVIELNSFVENNDELLFVLDENFDLNYFTEKDNNYKKKFESVLNEKINLIFEIDFQIIVG